jgi:putative phage-type endonuclease
MKVINLQQGSREWLSFRRSKIMASDTPIILGKSPYCSPFTLWQRKLGLTPEQEETPAMRRGKDLEPIARGQFCCQFGIEMTPLVVESDDLPWMAASLDGYSKIDNSILEIKCNGKKNHDIALGGEVPESHWLQMQHQMYVSGVQLGYYYSFDGEEGITIEVKFDPDAFNAIIPALYQFWRGLILLEPPALTEGDYKDMATDTNWQRLANRYTELDQVIKWKEKEKDDVRRQLIQLCGDNNCKGSGIKLLKTLTKGKIPYSEIEEIKAMDLEPHRKDSTTSWRVYVE